MEEQDSTQSALDHLSATPEDEASVPSSPVATTTRWLNILQRITEGTIAHLDLPELLHELLGRIRDAMQVDNAAILLLSDDGTDLTVYAARGPEEDATGIARVPMGRGVAGTIAAKRETMIINDLSRVHVVNPFLRATARSLVGAPLLAGDRVIGVIHIDSARLRHFTLEDSQLLQVIAGRVALAIEHAQLYEAERVARQEAEVSARHLRVLQAVSDVALEHTQLDDLLRALLERIQTMLEVDNVAILLPTPDGNDLTLYSVRGPEAAVMGQVFVPFGQGVAGTIAATRAPLVIENLMTVPVSNPFLRQHFRSLLGVPLLASGRLIGVIHVDSVRPRTFTEDELHMLQVMADRIALAIARAQQYESSEQSRTRAEHQVSVLRETTERMDVFLGIASHELRTPLTSLSMNMQILDFWLNSSQGRREDESDSAYAMRAIASVRPLIQRSRHSVQRLDRLVGDLLDASRVREERLALQQEHVDLISIVREVVDEYREAHAPRELRLEIGAPGPVVVDADADRIGQVLSNYLSNAVKYSLAEYPVVVTVRVEDGQAQVSVRDEGVGIPEHELEHIWERFYRVADIGHQSGSQVGLGLGLYITRDIVERHGGRIGVTSTPGEGSVFWFTLPLARPEGES